MVFTNLIGAPASRGTITGAGGTTDGHHLNGPALLELGGTWDGSVAVESSSDGGTTWLNCLGSDYSQSAITIPGMISLPAIPKGTRMVFRLNATLVSGTVEWAFII